MQGYKAIKVGDLSQKSLQNALNGGTLAIPVNKMTGSRTMLVHPMNYKKYMDSKKKNRGVRLQIAPGEVNADLEYHASHGGSLHGGSIWSWIKEKAYPWLKNNWNTIRPVVSQVVDAAVPFLSAKTGSPGAVNTGRQLLKDLTGVGVGGRLPKGSAQAKQRMAALRALKKGSGGSFKL